MPHARHHAHEARLVLATIGASAVPPTLNDLAAATGVPRELVRLYCQGMREDGVLSMTRRNPHHFTITEAGRAKLARALQVFTGLPRPTAN